MLASELAQFLADKFDVPHGTALDRGKALRAAGLLSKGRQGPNRGAHMTSADAVNLLLANVIEHKRGEDVASNVRRARTLPAQGATLEIPEAFVRGVAAFEAPWAGTALDSLLDDLRTARFATWAAGETYSFSVAVENRGRQVCFSIGKPKRDEMDFRHAMRDFATPDRAGQPPLIEQQTTIREAIFQQLATALGPPTPS